MSNFFINNLFTNTHFFLSWILFVMFSVSFHEYMHTIVALREGDPTAAEQGHLTLNPLKQMGITSLIMLCFIGICWGKVPVNPANFKNKNSNLKISMAGPLANLFLSAVFIILILIFLFLFNKSQFLSEERFNLLFNMLLNGSVLNIVLFIFNILPVPGFDGWALVENFMPDHLQNSEFSRGASLVILIIAVMWSSKLFEFAYFLTVSTLDFSVKILGMN